VCSFSRNNLRALDCIAFPSMDIVDSAEQPPITECKTSMLNIMLHLQLFTPFPLFLLIQSTRLGCKGSWACIHFWLLFFIFSSFFGSRIGTARDVPLSTQFGCQLPVCLMSHLSEVRATPNRCKGLEDYGICGLQPILGCSALHKLQRSIAIKQSN
jgi:hypothetical protein